MISYHNEVIEHSFFKSFEKRNETVLFLYNAQKEEKSHLLA